MALLQRSTGWHSTSKPSRCADDSAETIRRPDGATEGPAPISRSPDRRPGAISAGARLGLGSPNSATRRSRFFSHSVLDLTPIETEQLLQAFEPQQDAQWREHPPPGKLRERAHLQQLQREGTRPSTRGT
jgi:hypothetical protein